MKLDFGTVAMVAVVGVAVIAFNGSIPPQPEPLPGSVWDELNNPLPLPIGFGLLAVVLAMGAFLHSSRGMKSGIGGYILAGGVLLLVIWSAYTF